METTISHPYIISVSNARIIAKRATVKALVRPAKLDSFLMQSLDVFAHHKRHFCTKENVSLNVLPVSIQILMEECANPVRWVARLA